MNNKIKAQITVKPQSTYCDFCGRWEITEDYASSTACGSWFRVGFSGETALLCFDTSECVEAFPHIYISVDKGAMIECPVSEAIRIRATHDGVHEVQVTVKSSLETQERWFSPTAKVSFMGLAGAVGAPLEDYKTFTPLFEEDVYESLDLVRCVNERKVYGGPAKESVERQIAGVEAFLNA